MQNKKRILLALFLLTLAAGVAYPVRKIVLYDFSPAAEYRFEAGIVDPYDPFRGRYVTLSPLPTEVVLSEDKQFDYDEEVYAVLSTDASGIAQVVDLTHAPVPGRDAVRVRSYRYGRGADQDETYPYRLSLPFTRFYMNEKLAPQAERAVEEAARRNDGTCVIVVRIYKDGNYSIRDLELEGIPIRESLKQHEERTD